MYKLKNISLKTFRDYLLHSGLHHIRTKGGHEVWSAKDLTRPVILQTHVDPIAAFYAATLGKCTSTRAM